MCLKKTTVTVKSRTRERVHFRLAKIEREETVRFRREIKLARKFGKREH